MQIAVLAVVGYVVLTATCLAALMSLAARIRRRDKASPPVGRRRRLHT